MLREFKLDYYGESVTIYAKRVNPRIYATDNSFIPVSQPTPTTLLDALLIENQINEFIRHASNPAVAILCAYFNSDDLARLAYLQSCSIECLAAKASDGCHIVSDCNIDAFYESLPQAVIEAARRANCTVENGMLKCGSSCAVAKR